jgi:2-methylisocitrate lyase-like PEP mutase family enzyme
MAFVEAPQTEDEIAAVPRLVNGPCLLNVVRGGKTPDIDLRHAEALGYKLAILPGLLIKNVVGICDKMLAELKTTRRHPPPIKEMTLPGMFRRFGADEWDVRRSSFRNPMRNAAE